ncbi:MAG: hypothetical protein HC906_19250 [Bacteroidales bacterium]|nr:hypothetical protein [Bacteroidales bacterium]
MASGIDASAVGNSDSSPSTTAVLFSVIRFEFSHSSRKLVIAIVWPVFDAMLTKVIFLLFCY